MSDVVVKVENLGKRYRYGGAAPLSQSLRSDIADWVKGWLRRDDKPRASLRAVREANIAESPDYFWALKDVSLEIKRGEVVGIIGRNGAGKSTLLKILSRITPPTTGRITYRGRVASLLEVGTGFHRELTGRENVFLNGSILGMKRSEITRKFDEIVAFAEVEKFIDTPVKFYSSGMYVRLAFAVAAHLEPEILVIDEVLAVGDAAFQKRCLGKMGQVAKEGRTVLFVSHNMIAIKSLCERAVFLREGRLDEDGPAADVVRKYLNTDRISRAEVVWIDPKAAPGAPTIRLHSVRVLNKSGNVASAINIQEPLEVEIEYWNLQPGQKLGTTLLIHNEDGVCVFASISNHETNWHGKPRPKGLFRSRCKIPGNMLTAGTFGVTVLLWLENYQVVHQEQQTVEFEIQEGGGVRGDFLGKWSGIVRPWLEWDTTQVGGN